MSTATELIGKTVHLTGRLLVHVQAVVIGEHNGGVVVRYHQASLRLAPQHADYHTAEALNAVGIIDHANPIHSFIGAAHVPFLVVVE